MECALNRLSEVPRAAGEIGNGVQAGSDWRVLGPWYVAEFLGSYASTLFLSGVYDFARENEAIHAGPSARLWLSAAWGFAYIFISLLAGRIAEKFGPRRSAVGAMGTTALTALLALLAVRFPGLLVLAAVMLPCNFTCSSIWPAIVSGVTRTKAKRDLSSRIMLYNLAWSGGGFAAFFTHGILEDWSWSLIFVAPAIAAGFGAVVLGIWGVTPAKHGEHLAETETEAAGEDANARAAEEKRGRMFLWIAWIGNGLAYLAVYTLFPVTTQLAVMAGVKGLGAAGFVGSIWFMVRVAAFGVLFLWTGWHYRFGWQIGPLLAMAASLMGMLIVHDLAVFIVLQAVFGMAIAVLYSGSLYYAMHVSAGHGGHAGLHEAIIGIGTTAGPTIGAVFATGDLGAAAMRQIAIGVTAVLVVGAGVMGWMAAKGGSGARRAAEGTA